MRSYLCLKENFNILIKMSKNNRPYFDTGWNNMNSFSIHAFDVEGSIKFCDE